MHCQRPIMYMQHAAHVQILTRLPLALSAYLSPRRRLFRSHSIRHYLPLSLSLSLSLATFDDSHALIPSPCRIYTLTHKHNFQSFAPYDLSAH